MNNITKIEYKKIFSRIEFWCSLIILIIPIVLFLGSKMDASIAMAIATKSRFSTTVISLGFALQLGLYHLLFSILATNLLSVELSTNYTTLYFPHIKDRASLYTKKNLAISTVLLSHILLYGIFSLGVSYFILNDLTSFFDQETIWYVLTILGWVLELLTFVNIILLTGIFLQPLQNIFLAVIMFVSNSLFFDLPIIGKVLPMHYIQRLMGMENKGDNQFLIYNFMIVFSLTIFYNIVIQIIGRKSLKNYSQ